MCGMLAYFAFATTTASLASALYLHGETGMGRRAGKPESHVKLSKDYTTPLK